jgi:hypothetical protein
MAEAPTELETYYLGLVNDTRAAAGVLPLTFDGELMNAADDHNAWMDETDTLSHTGINGTSPEDRIRAAGYEPAEPWLARENIWSHNGYDPDTGEPAGATQKWVRESHTWFVNSPPHYANLTDPEFEHIGISFMEGDFLVVPKDDPNDPDDQAGEPQIYPAAFATITFGKPSAEEAADDPPTAGEDPDDPPTAGEDPDAPPTTGEDPETTPVPDDESGGYIPPRSAFEVATDPGLAVDPDLVYGELDYGDCLTCGDPDGSRDKPLY